MNATIMNDAIMNDTIMNDTIMNNTATIPSCDDELFTNDDNDYLSENQVLNNHVEKTINNTYTCQLKDLIPNEIKFDGCIPNTIYINLKKTFGNLNFTKIEMKFNQLTNTKLVSELYIGNTLSSQNVFDVNSNILSIKILPIELLNYHNVEILIHNIDCDLETEFKFDYDHVILKNMKEKKKTQPKCIYLDENGVLRHKNINPEGIIDVFKKVKIEIYHHSNILKIHGGMAGLKYIYNGNNIYYRNDTTPSDSRHYMHFDGKKHHLHFELINNNLEHVRIKTIENLKNINNVSACIDGKNINIIKKDDSYVLDENDFNFENQILVISCESETKLPYFYFLCNFDKKMNTDEENEIYVERFIKKWHK